MEVILKPAAVVLVGMGKEKSVDVQPAIQVALQSAPELRVAGLIAARTQRFQKTQEALSDRRGPAPRSSRAASRSLTTTTIRLVSAPSANTSRSLRARRASSSASATATTTPRMSLRSLAAEFPLRRHLPPRSAAPLSRSYASGPHRWGTADGYWIDPRWRRPRAAPNVGASARAIRYDASSRGRDN